MIRRLINTLQGKRWAAKCELCGWTAGRADLLQQHARNRLELHANTRHHSELINDGFRWMTGEERQLRIEADKLRCQIRLTGH